MAHVDLQLILDLLSRRAGRPLSLRDIQTALDLDAKERKAVSRLLKNLVREGTIVELKGDRYALPGKVNLVTGTLTVHRDGYGFVTVPDRDHDVFVPARYVRPAMPGDRVVVRVERGARSGRPEGRVIRVVERARVTLVGRYEQSRGVGYLVPADTSLHDDLIIPAGAEAGARPGQMVVARIDSYPDQSRNAVASVVEVLGDADDPAVEIRVAAIRFGLPDEFPAAVLAEVARLPEEVAPADLVGREDLRARPFVTIDGETARDFDDAVAIERRPDGYRLWVAIADVGHYVQVGSAIDREALNRGTSVYFPSACIPMLPEALSNGLCSLNPAVDRLVMVAELDLDSTGQRRAARFFAGVIHSQARLTYTEVRKVLVDRDPACRSQYQPLVPELELMGELAALRMARRHERGSIDFDLPEAEIHLDLRGRPENIVRSERNLAHRLIEEFMLAANEAVADWLERQRTPLVFRIHEPPSEEKMIAFQEFIAYFNQGISIPTEGVKPKLLQELLERVAGRPEERVINHVLLRSLTQARYSTENRGHFGLAADCYCHFTSPIRRYPDLTVHRSLKERLGIGPHAAGGGVSLTEIAERTSHCERRAMEAERDIVDLKKCQFMASRVGETFPGLVTSVQAFGFFVELDEFMVEGLVHISSLEDDFYQYEEERHRLIGMNRRRQFEIGHPVEVVVAKVDLERREIDFRLVGDSAAEPVRQPRRQGRQGRQGRQRRRS